MLSAQLRSSTPEKSENYLGLESLLLGGFSILACLGFWTFTDKGARIGNVPQTAFALAVLCNYPHFMASYVLLYGDFRKKIFTIPRYFWAAVVVPVLLGGAFLYALLNSDFILMGRLINLSFFTAGWHYIKQVFGCVIVTSVRRKVYFKSWERDLLLASLFGLWIMNWALRQHPLTTPEFYGIAYQPLPLPGWCDSLTIAWASLSGIAVAGMFLHKYIYEGLKPSAPGLMAFLALYVWYIPLFYHPGFALFVPFFHCLQYLVFVWQFKKNKILAKLNGLNGPELRSRWIKETFGYAALLVVLGVLSFHAVPNLLDSAKILNAPTLGTTPIYVAFYMFINIHHAFIDHVIWRSDNEEMKTYLFAGTRDLSDETRAAA